jgi:hypothetical protein
MVKMTIILSEKYKLTSDAGNVILEEKKIVKAGENKGLENWENIGYYPNLQWAVNAVIRKGIQTTEVEGIQNIINCIKEAVASLSGQIEVLQEGGCQGD